MTKKIVTLLFLTVAAIGAAALYFAGSDRGQRPRAQDEEGGQAVADRKKAVSEEMSMEAAPVLNETSLVTSIHDAADPEDQPPPEAPALSEPIPSPEAVRHLQQIERLSAAIEIGGASSLQLSRAELEEMFRLAASDELDKKLRDRLQILLQDYLATVNQ